MKIDQKDMSNQSDTLYIHLISGDIATLDDWLSDYHNMDLESWHGKPIDEINPDDWLIDGRLIPHEDNKTMVTL